MFTCETDAADFTEWSVNGTSYTDLPQRVQKKLKFKQEGVQDNDNELYSLFITAIAPFNGTTVQCVTGDFGGALIKSEKVTLMIQGIHIIQAHIIAVIQDSMNGSVSLLILNPCHM